MLHIITENNELKNRKFPIPDGVRKILQKTLKNYNGDKTIDGYKRLNNILSMDGIAYNEMKRIKNFFDNYGGTDKSPEYILNGGDAMKTWVNNTLYTATKAVHDYKQAKKDAGIDNAFIRPHEKDRQNKKKNKPTQAKFKTNNLSSKMLDGNDIKYESLLRESIDLEEYYYDYGVDYVLNSFRESGKGSTQNWGVLINPSMYQKALTEFTKYGSLTSFPTKYIYQWIGIIAKNTCILEANTELAGHTQYLPIEEIEMFIEEELGDRCYDVSNDNVYIKLTEEEFVELCSQNGIYLDKSNGIDKDGQYDLYQKMAEELNEKSINYYGIQTRKIQVFVNEHVICDVKGIFQYLDEIGLYDWMTMPDGSDAWSDYGLQPIYKLLTQYNDDYTPEKTLVLINKILDVYHQRGDLSSIFIQGGKSSLTSISNGAMHENRKRTICISEQQLTMLKEAMDDTFSLDALSSLPSFNARFKYCTEHLGKHIGKGSSRATFQIDDETVLKLAWNDKGVAQNDEEARAYGDDIFPQVKDYDPNGQWLISEFVLPAKAQDFKHCFNMTFKQFCSFIRSCGSYRFGRRYWDIMKEEEWLNWLENNEELQAFDDYIGNYGRIVVGDMCRLCNYGLTKRDGEAHIVLLDSGLTEDVWNNYYKR